MRVHAQPPEKPPSPLYEIRNGVSLVGESVVGQAGNCADRRGRGPFENGWAPEGHKGDTTDSRVSGGVRSDHLRAGASKTVDPGEEMFNPGVFESTPAADVAIKVLELTQTLPVPASRKRPFDPFYYFAEQVSLAICGVELSVAQSRPELVGESYVVVYLVTGDVVKSLGQPAFKRLRILIEAARCIIKFQSPTVWKVRKEAVKLLVERFVVRDDWHG
ncbi:hypothetical protein HDU87_002298 [Geranomyces variabilis]|uniref:Uncharacterized protein n=1 Tax=Geranomyces variabilis TaxID=109894 RepID=A0AAD5XS62_9FUNG|nr:hypothetical protein HDU87_002298 [Geranomyces variabilis]